MPRTSFVDEPQFRGTGRKQMKLAVAVALQRSRRTERSFIGRADADQTLTTDILIHIDLQASRNIRPSIARNHWSVGNDEAIFGGNNRNIFIDRRPELHGIQLSRSTAQRPGQSVVGENQPCFRQSSRVFEEQRVRHRADEVVKAMIAFVQQACQVQQTAVATVSKQR